MEATVEIGEDIKLEIFTCPESNPTHSPDQLLILYSPKHMPKKGEKTDNHFHPTDDIIFSGDLWLMRGPIFERSLRSITMSMRFMLYRLRDSVSGRSDIRRFPLEQDAKAKDALKQGFSLIRVKPGHGNEFLGSNMIPKALLADRDLLIKLGFSMDDDKSVLRSNGLIPKVSALREKAHISFIDTLNLWMDMGYDLDDIAGLLARIYVEQSGGGRLVEQDRKERRKRLKKTLIRLKSEKNKPDDLYQIAESALSEINTLNKNQ